MSVYFILYIHSAYSTQTSANATSVVYSRIKLIVCVFVSLFLSLFVTHELDFLTIYPHI